MDIFGTNYLNTKIEEAAINFWIVEKLNDLQIVWLLVILVTIFFVIIIYLYRRWSFRQLQKELIRSSQTQSITKLRFRKRDKMLFYGRRMLRKVKNVSGQVYGGQGKKRKAVMRFARNILQLKKENSPMQMKTVEPPSEYLEATSEGMDKVPPDALYILQGIRVFGHFEKPIFLQLVKNTEVMNLKTNEILFKINDPDDSIYIVQSGLITVFISNNDGSTVTLKSVKKGESVTSLLSFIDILSSNASYYKTVIAKALEPSQVIRLPLQAFKEVFQENPEIMVRVIQIIMVRLQRVIFTALRNYLGLTSELCQENPRTRKSYHFRRSSLQSTKTYVSVTHSLVDTPLLAQAPDMIVDIADKENLPNIDSAKTIHTTRKNSLSMVDVIDSRLILNSAIESFMKELGLKENDRFLLVDNVEIKELEPGITLIEEENSDDVCLWFVMSGALSILQTGGEIPGVKKKDKKESLMYNVYPGDLFGGLAILTGEASIYTVRSETLCRLAFITRQSVYKIMRERPHIALNIGNSVIRRLSPLVRQCDYALDWIFLESGRAVYKQEEISDSTYIVLSGRLRSVIKHSNGKKEIVGEYGKGDLVGIVEMITETPRTTTVMAVRDSELAKLPEGLFNAIKIRYPIVVSKLISLLSHRILGSMQSGSGTAPLEANPVTHKFSTVALVPVSEDVPLTAFTYELYHSLCAIGPTLRLTSEFIRKSLGAGILESSSEYRLTTWLAQQEDQNIIVLYQCDPSLSLWTQRCMRQSDVILIVGLGDRTPTVGKFEREIDRLALRTQKELILLHHEANNSKPTNTLQWLNIRPWVTNHHHIHCPKRMFSRKSQYRINDLYSRVLMSEANMHSDFSRLARWLTGNSVGLVLGGGGARGAAHVGMMKAIQEAGIPIDMVGGVSIGAFMGALWCAERDITIITQKARGWSMKMTQWLRQLLDLTYPITSMFSGRGFNATIHDTFGDVYIEDLWIPYFTLTTDITASCARVHTNGCLWRYVRASMTIAGVFPPFCDYKDGHLLLDGCYTNNVPADVMRNLGAAHIIAVDVGSQDDTDLTNYGDSLSGWWLIYKKWWPFTTPVKVPDLPDIQSRLAYVSCVRQLEEVKNSDYCEYIRPPIDKYKTLAFNSFNEIRDVGYVHGKNHFEAMAKVGRLGRFNRWFNLELPKKFIENPSFKDQTSFIDLAQIVCKLPEYIEMKQDLFSDEEFDGYISEPSTLHTNARTTFRIKRGGGSLSLSENEMDSDDMDISLPLKLDSSKKSHSSTQSLVSDMTPEAQFDDDFDSSVVPNNREVVINKFKTPSKQYSDVSMEIKELSKDVDDNNTNNKTITNDTNVSDNVKLQNNEQISIKSDEMNNDNNSDKKDNLDPSTPNS